MEEANKEFVEKNLSSKSSFYIINDLFKNTSRIEAEMICLDNYDQENIFIVGDLHEAEYELYIIMDSLFRRVLGTRERINGMYIDSDDDVNFLNQRNARLRELESDWGIVRSRLYRLLETRHSGEIDIVRQNNPKLLQTRFYWATYNAFSGYVFVFFKEKKFGMTNHYAMGGD